MKFKLKDRTFILLLVFLFCIFLGLETCISLNACHYHTCLEYKSPVYSSNIAYNYDKVSKTRTATTHKTSIQALCTEPFIAAEKFQRYTHGPYWFQK